SINEHDQMLFISTDEGSSFQRQPVSFTYTMNRSSNSHDPENLKKLIYLSFFIFQLYISTDLGHKWTLLQDHFTLLKFLGKIDHNSLSVQDEYIFVKVTTGNRTKYYVSFRRNEFVQMRFPKYALPKDVQIVSTDENQVFLALQEWYQTDTYNLYQSDPQGVYYSIVLENVRSTKQPEENVLIDILEVRGIKGVFLANQKVDGKVMTLITYNKGRDWEPLAPPTTDMNGKPVSCKQPDCHLHLHLRWADNPYVSGTVHTKDSAPGLIMGAGNLGSQLVEYKEEMYITSDCGKTWRQVFEEEHHILYLDHGGVIVAIKDTSIPLKILKFSIDEGLSWSIHNFTSTSVFVDGLLSEPGDETLVMTVFGHISYRSDWELVKVDFRQSFPRQCTEADYDSWKLTDLQGEKCIMGQERMYRRRKESSFCIKGKSYTSALTAKPCQCTEKDFACDYGFERAPSLRLEGDRCYPDFWHDPDAPPENCHLGHSYKSSTGYRKVIANVCEGGLNKEQSAKQHSCPLLAPKGLQLGIKGQMLAVAPGDEITFIVHQEQGDTTRTRYQVDLMDGVRAIYENLTVTDEPIQHRYEKPGVYRVNVKAENSAGHDQATLYIQVTAPLQDVHLEVVPIAGRNQEVNLTAIVLPTEANLTVFYWWIGDNLQPKLTLENSLIARFSEEGEVPVTVQASNGRSMVQDSKTVIRLSSDQFQIIPLSFSRNLDRFNPNIPEWRQDVGQVVTKILAKLTGVPQDSLVTMVKPGLPTTADLYVLPQESTPVKRSVFVDKRVPTIKQVLSENNVSFIVRGGLRVLVTLPDYITEHELQNCDRKNYKNHGSLLRPEESSLTRPWLRFRKLPGRNVYAQMYNEKEQEMTSPVNHSEDTQNIIQGEEFIDDDLDSQTLGNAGGRSQFSYARLTRKEKL
uniref:VPS10 domain-containing receptor SorCS2 n=1 Tax=Sinocyclocheilus rhinocerous TaxID=307959 RepID=A0A673LW94_9TELE